LLKYKEINWKHEKGFKIRKYDIFIDTIAALKTREEQQPKVEKISLVAFLKKEQKEILLIYADA